jgi:diguanylate cyclase (GGDEF)-like protein
MDIPSTTSRPRKTGLPDKTQTSLDVVLRCFVSAIDADTGMIVGMGSRGRPELLAATGHAARTSTVPWTPGSFLGKALAAEGVSLEESSHFHDAGSAPSAWHAIASQITGPAGSLGAIYAGWENASHEDRAHLAWAAEAHAHLAALCMSDEGAPVATVLRSSGLDQLTGCLTYERVLDMLRGEVQRSERQGHRLSCCFFDIDHFKSINDEHGHLQGNRVLASTGDALLSAARGFDCVGRFGGDEFVLVMPETSLEDARKASTRMREAVRSAVDQATGLQITASVGVAEWKRGDSMLQLLEASDRALQTAKASGGSVIHASPSAASRLDGLVELVRRAQVLPRTRATRKNGD